MKDILETVFSAVLQFLADEKYISLEHYFVDGTKIEANANRYTFVWGKAVRKYKAKLQEKVHTLFADIEAAEEKEEKEPQGKDFAEFGTEVGVRKLEQAVQSLKFSLQKNRKTIP